MNPKRGFGAGRRPAEKGDVKQTLKRLSEYARGSIGWLGFSLFLSAVHALMTIFAPGFLGQITQIISDGLTTGIDMAALSRTGIFLLLFYLVSGLTSFFAHFIMCTVMLRISNRLRADLTAKINRVPMKLFGKMPYGDMLSRMTNDVQALTQTVSNSLPTLIVSGAQFIGCLVMMFVTEWRLAVAALVSTLAGFGLMTLIMKRSQPYFTAQQASLGALNGYIEEMYSGHDVLRLSCAEEQTLKRFGALNRDVYDANRKAQFLSGIMRPLMGLVGNLGYVAVCVYGSFLALRGEIGFGTIIAFIMYVRYCSSPLSQIGQGMTQMQTAAAAGQRVFDYLAEEELSDESALAPYTKPCRGQVSFDHVRFGYTDDKIVIEDFSAEALPGQKVAIVGPTGAGKTTLVNLLMRFFEVRSGSIRIDGTDIREIRRCDVHDLFSMVLQDTWLFRGTVRENLVYNKKDVSDEKLEEALEACGMLDFVRSLPNGLDTMLDENTTISAGQKQLFTIARAMVQNSPMLILDEATSSVDTRTELITQAAMDRLMAKRTSFVIAHRLSTIKNADLILVLKDGNVIEQGTHASLLEQNGFYADLYNSQFTGPQNS